MVLLVIKQMGLPLRFANKFGKIDDETC